MWRGFIWRLALLLANQTIFSCCLKRLPPLQILCILGVYAVGQFRREAQTRNYSNS